MATISSVGGTSAQEQIQQLVDASLAKYTARIENEQLRVKNYEKAQDAWEDIRTSLNSLRSSLLNLRSSTTFYSRTATSSETNLVTAVANSTAPNTSYVLKDITLAKGASISSSAVLGLSDGDYTYHQSASTIDDGTDVDPNQNLNAAASHIHDNSQLVAGSFTINGVSISYDPATDTLYEVLSKINSSAAGVTATFNASGADKNKIVITSDTLGDEDITFSDPNNTNFFDVMHVDTGTATHSGSDAQWDQLIQDVPGLDAVTDGFFSINNITFNVDIDTDSLQDVMNRINDSQAGVTVFYNESLDKLVMTSKETGEDITMSNDTSGFLNAMKVLDVTGDQDGNAGSSRYAFTQSTVTVNDTVMHFDSNVFTINGTTFTLHANTETGEEANIEVSRDTATAKSKIEDFINKYNALYDMLEQESGDGNSLNDDRIVSSLMSNMRRYVISSVDNDGQYSYLRQVGITYDDGHLSLDSGELESAMTSDPDAVAKIFAYDSNNDALRDNGGFANDLISSIIDPLVLEGSGTITRRINLLDTNIDRLNDRIDTMESQYETKETNLTDQYYKYLTAMYQLQQQQQWLAGVLSSG